MAGEVAEIALMSNDPRLCATWLKSGELNSGELGGAELREAALERLIERARAGDAEAFDQIMICCQRKVVIAAWRILGSEDEARDAAQEVFLRLYKYLKSYRPGQSFGAWLYKISVNVCRDMVRGRPRKDRFVFLDDDGARQELETLAGPADAEASAILVQERMIIARAMDTLSPKEREAIVLRDLEGLATVDVARILGSSQSTVRSQVSAARAKIKRYRDRVLGQRRRR